MTTSPAERTADPSIETTPGSGGNRRAALIIAVGAAVAGLVLRAWVVTSQLGVIESDEAVGALIARRLFSEPEWQTFLWGNEHGGSLEAIPTAVVFALFGVSTIAAKVVPIALAAVASVLTGLLARRLSGEPLGGAVAGAIVWLLPGHFLVLSTKAWLYYGASLALVSLIMLIVARLDIDGDTWAPSRRRAVVFALGLTVGLGLWASVFVFFVAVPAGLWYAMRNIGQRSQWWTLVPGVAIGGAPWWVFNLRYGFASLDPQDAAPSTYSERLGNFVPELLPRALGVREPGWGSWVWGGVGRWMFALMLIALVATVVRHRRVLTLPAAVVVGYPFVWAAPANTIYFAEPRYGIFLAPALAVIAGVGVAGLAAGAGGQRRAARSPALAVVVLGVIVVASFLGVRGLDRFATLNPGRFSVNPPEIGPLVELLDDRDIDTLFAEYWISYRLMFETDQRIVATPIEFPRNPEINQLVYDSQSQVWALPLDGFQDQRLGDALAGLDVSADRVVVDEFAVWFLSRPVFPPEVPQVLVP